VDYVVKLIVFVTILLPFNVFAADQYFSSVSAASTACNQYVTAASGSSLICDSTTFTDVKCGGNGQAVKYYKQTNWGAYYGNYLYCNSGPASCPTGQIRDINGNCVCPSGTTLINNACVSNCTAGQTKTLFEYQATMTIYVGSGPTLSDAGCQYNCSGSLLDVFQDSQGKNYDKFSCTSTGVASTANAAADSTGLASSSKTTTQPDGATCTTLADGRKLCTGGTLGTSCFTLNGVKTCPKDANTSTIADTTVKATDAKNCVRSGSSTLCQVAATDPARAFCGSVSGTSVCYSTTATRNATQTAATANPDGSTSVTKTITDSVVGNGPVTETTTTFTDGHSITKTTGGLSGTDGLANLLGQIADNTKNGSTVTQTDCDKYPNTVGCMSLSDVPEPDAIPSKDLSVTISGDSISSVGTCPAPKAVHLSKVTVSLSFDVLCQFATKINPLVIGFAWLSSAFLLSGALKNA
jgi:hypothetical protein